MRRIKFEVNGLQLMSDNDRLRPSKRGRLFCTEEYRIYKKDLTLLFSLQRPQGWQTIQGPFGIRIKVWTHKDQSNLIKAVLDALEDAEIIRNDKYCDRLYMVKEPQKRTEPEKMKIEVIDREEQAFKKANLKSKGVISTPEKSRAYPPDGSGGLI